MRILQIHNAYRQRGGEDAVAEAEADLLAGAGHDVRRLIVTNPEGNIAAAANLVMAPWNPRSARLVRNAIETFRPDVAHVHNTWYSLSSSALDALRTAGVPTVMTLHNYRFSCLNGQLLRDGAVCELCLGRSTVRGIRYRCYRGSLPSSIIAAAGSVTAHRSWPHVDRFIVMTEFAGRKFAASGLPTDRMVVKPHFVADPGPRSAPPAESRYVLFVGRLSTEKGIDVLIDAWRLATLEGYELVVVGDGPLRSTLAGDAPPRVRFTGWLSPAKVHDLMLGARLLTFPSVWYETFGLSMVEAMAAGTPVLASALGGTPEIIGAPDRDRLVTPGIAAEWAARLRQVVADDLWIAEVGNLSRRRYENHYTPEHALHALENIYESITS